MSTKFGSFSVPTSAVGTTIPLTGFGFTPKAILFWWCGINSAVDAHLESVSTVTQGYGFATSPSSRCVGATYNYQGKLQRQDACITRMATSSTIDGLVDIQSFDADGVTLVIDDQFTTGIRVHYLAIGNIPNAAIGAFQNPTAVGMQDITGLSFKPDCVMILGLRDENAPPHVAASGGQRAFGVAVSAAQQATLTWSSSPSSSCRRGEVIYGHQAGGAPDRRASLDSFLANGFRLNWAETGATQHYFFYLALQGKYGIIDFTSKTDTASFAVTGLGFRPEGLLVASISKGETAADTSETTEMFWSFGGASGPADRGAMYGFSYQFYGVEHDEMYVHPVGNPSGTGNPTALMDLLSFDTDGFTAIMDDAENSAAQFCWALAIGKSGDILTASNLTVSSPAFGTPAYAKNAFDLIAVFPPHGPTIDAATFGQKHKFVGTSITVGRPIIQIPGLLTLSAQGLTVGSPEIAVPPPAFAHPYGPHEQIPTLSQQIQEADEILQRALDALVGAVPTRIGGGRAAWDFRRTVGDIRANSKRLIFDGTLGTPAALAWTLATDAGATFDTMDAARLKLLVETPQFVPAQSVAHLTQQLTVAQMSRIAAQTTFVSRERALSMLTRISAAYAPVEDDLADEQDAMMYRSVVALRAATVRDLAARGRQLPRVVRFDFQISMPGLWLANRIYADASRCEELRDENDWIHPAFPPPAGICLSR
jgi:hypothetical protein